MLTKVEQPLRRWHLRPYVLALALAVAVTAGLIVASRLGGGSAKPVATGSGGVTGLLDGIPQHGIVLGSPQAPVTLVEYADLQCPICAAWTARTLPTVVQRYVRPGKVRIVFRGLDFLGPDSETALRVVLAAGSRDRLWHVVELLYRAQGVENTGWVTDGVLRAALTAAGVDAPSVLALRSSPAVTAEIATAAREAQADGIPGTPSFEVGRTGGPLGPVSLTSLDPSGLTPALDAALAG